MSEPLCSIKLTFCRLDIHPAHVETVFLDGASYGAYPHHTADYIALADWLGYQGDIKAYCIDHEFLHSFLQEELFGRPSRVLWDLAHGRKAPAEVILAEESLTILFQSFLRGRLRAMPAGAPGVNWYPIRDKALELLGDKPVSKAA